MINNLSQLKKAMKKGAKFRILDHTRPECIGEIRTVGAVQTNRFYSYVDDPNHKTYLANGGKGLGCDYRKASDYEFDNGKISMYINFNDGKHKPIHELIMTIEMVED